jgi:hypothetical protein
MPSELADVLKQLGLPPTITLIVSIAIIVIIAIAGIIKWIHWLVSRNNQWLLNENLNPYYSETDVKRATQYYIPTQYQNISPSADEEPGRTHIASAKNPLIPMFLKRVFENDHTDTKYYLILADTGMGKTTFLINLFLSYVSKPWKNLFGNFEHQKIKLLPLGSPDIWQDIENVSDKDKLNTILLLDAFDEDIKAAEDYDARMKHILTCVKKFKKIVITCRTQFFPSDKEIPDDTGYVSFGGDQDPYKFQRIYLSVFDKRDIKKYLKKRYSIFKIFKRKKAYKIVEKSPNLVMRPMLLSYINDLVETKKAFSYSYEIYEVLIDKWIERESKKHGIRVKYTSEEKYRELLRNFSQMLSLNLYENREKRGGYFINKNEVVGNSKGLQLSDVDNYGMSETEIRSKSLLNRNSEGRYKFSHKSILEYFLARELIRNAELISTFEFEGMSFVEKCLNEMLTDIRSLRGNFSLDDESEFYTLQSLNIRDIHKVKALSVSNSVSFNISNLAIFTNLKELTIRNPVNHFRLYALYDKVEANAKISPVAIFLPTATKFIRKQDLQYLEKRIDELHRFNNEDWKNMKDKGLFLPEVFRNTSSRITLSLAINFLKPSEYIRPFFYSKLGEEVRMKTWVEIIEYLKEMELLKEKLPNCTIWY